jgi:hypothetical protein
MFKLFLLGLVACAAVTPAMRSHASGYHSVQDAKPVNPLTYSWKVI